MHVSLAYSISLLHLQLWFTFISQLKRKSTKRNIYIGGFFVATCHAYVTLITDSYFPPLWERVQTMHDKPRLPATHVCNSMPNWYRVSLLAHPKKKLIKLTLSMSPSLSLSLSPSFSMISLVSLLFFVCNFQQRASHAIFPFYLPSILLFI